MSCFLVLARSLQFTICKTIITKSKMRRIKIKLPFSTADLKLRHQKLIEMAKILSNNNFFTVIEENHLVTMSYMIVLVENAFEYSEKDKNTKIKN